jgi:hypothetical protein
MSCNHLLTVEQLYLFFIHLKSEYVYMLFLLSAKNQILTFGSKLWVFVICACASVGTTDASFSIAFNICWLSMVDKENLQSLDLCI